MQGEYMTTYTISSGDTIDIPCPPIVYGIYSPAGSVRIEWVFNNTIGPICDGVIWEPMSPFIPAGTSYLRITASVQTVVTIRAGQ